MKEGRELTQFRKTAANKKAFVTGRNQSRNSRDDGSNSDEGHGQRGSFYFPPVPVAS
jgi:hypothetical protein